MLRYLQIILFFALFISQEFSVKAQNKKEEIIEELLESLTDDLAENNDYTSLVEELHTLYDKPININEATAEELEVLPMLSPIAIVNLLRYREEVKQIYTIYELNALRGFTPNVLLSLQHFIRFDVQKKREESIGFRDLIRYSNNSILFRGQRVFPEQYGYKKLQRTDFDSNEEYLKWEKRRYLGSPWRYYLRYRSSYKDRLKVGLVAEKDAGEDFFSGTQKRGFDHYAGFIQMNDIGILKTFILGDFSPRFGQGLTTWGGYNIGKTAYFLNVNKRNEGLKSYASTNENKFFRGVGASIQPLKRLNLTAYYSNKKIDGNVKTSAFDRESEYFSSFINSGYHRSHNELQNRKSIRENIVGANANYTYNNLKVGLSFIDYKFSKRFVGTESSANLYSFLGNHGLNYSSHISYRYNRVFVFGELGFDKQQSKALVGGILFNADESLSFSMLYRDYDKGYQALYASGFGDKLQTKNERGWYMGVEMLPWAKWKLNAYFDMYEFPWLRTGMHAPAKGYDSKIRLEHHHSEKINGYLQFYYEKNEKNAIAPIGNIGYLVDEKRRKYRIHIDYKVLPNLRFKNRAEFSYYEKEKEKYKGFMLFYDIVYRNNKFPVNFTTRYALFDVQDYKARIYTYENDILYSFSTPALQNRGFRLYLNMKWNISKKIIFWAKYAVTKYRDRNTISSGLNLIDSDTIRELKLQLQYKF